MTAPLPEMSDERIVAIMTEKMAEPRITVTRFSIVFARAVLSEGTASLKAELDDYRARLATQCGETLAARGERDALKAEREALSAELRRWIAANGPGGWINELRTENARLKAEHATLRAEFDAAALRFVAELDALREQMRSCWQDAARYRWICSHARSEAYDLGIEWGWHTAPGDSLNAPIDAALSTTPGKEEA
jgi:FtsZ-binding cell division protein ZapB